MCVCMCTYAASLAAQLVKNLPAMQETPCFFFFIYFY